MSDKTSRDVRLGDLSAVDAAGRDAGEPRVGSAGPLDPTRTQRAVHIAADSAPARPSWALPAQRPPLSVMLLGGCVVLLIGAVVFLSVQQRELGRGLAVLEASARDSVATLETRVASTTTTLKSSDSETQKSLDLIAADIGKLDAGITRLSRQLEQESRTRAVLDAELKSVAAELRKADLAGTQLDAQFDTRMKTLADNIDQLAARQATQADGLAKLARSGDAAQLRSDVAVLAASVRDMQDEHEKRLKATEQAVSSSDAFRRQVNATIDRLNQQMTELYQRR